MWCSAESLKGHDGWCELVSEPVLGSCRPLLVPPATIASSGNAEIGCEVSQSPLYGKASLKADLHVDPVVGDARWTTQCDAQVAVDAESPDVSTQADKYAPVSRPP